MEVGRFTLPIYLCRWPDGSFSIVGARNKTDATAKLDKFGDAGDFQLWRMPACLLDFWLSDEGYLELINAADPACSFIMERCYPVLVEAWNGAEKDRWGRYTLRGFETIRQAVCKERKRLWKYRPKPKLTDTELGRRIQRKTNSSAAPLTASRRNS